MAKLFLPASVEAVKRQLLEDYELEALKNGITVPVSPGSDADIWATADANIAFLQFGNIARVEPSLTPLTADEEGLERWKQALQLPDADASVATGAIKVTVVGTSAIPAGQQFVLPNGLRGEFTETKTVIDGTEVLARTIDTGEATNTNQGTKVRLVNPPLNVATEAEVSTVQPLRGGSDKETPARLRTRILNKLRFQPAAGNVGQLRDSAFRASPAVQQAFVYPALGGPATSEVVVLKAYEPKDLNYSRALNSAALALVREQIQREMPQEVETFVRTVTDVPTDVAVRVTLPASLLSGGNGQGWLDSTPWPPLTGAETRVTAATITSSIAITIDATVVTGAVAGQTRIAWWNAVDRRPEVRTVVAIAGSAGAWQLTLDRALVSSNGATIATGDFIFPAAANLDGYAETWVELMNDLGPGELTSDVGQRRKRRPFVSEGAPIALSSVQLSKMVAAHPEIADIAYSYRQATSPAVPGSIATNPNVLTVRRFAVYPT